MPQIAGLRSLHFNPGRSTEALGYLGIITKGLVSLIYVLYSFLFYISEETIEVKSRSKKVTLVRNVQVASTGALRIHSAKVRH